jgi:hypothetical protein
VLSLSALTGSDALKSLTFEAGSTLLEFGRKACSTCRSLESISVPASVEVLGEYCFAGLTHLSSLTFEPGSKLRAIEHFAFSSCFSLRSISLPASLAVINGLSFDDSAIEKVFIDESNPHYFVSGDFVVTFDGKTLIRYFGHSKNVIIGRDIETLGEGSFTRCKSVVRVAFEADSRLRQFGEYAFSECQALTSICIPAQTEHICELCFAGCRLLRAVTFEHGSKLTRIDRGAFLRCRSLRSFFIPAQLEIFESNVCTQCESISQLTFEVPSKLKQLYLPISDFGSLCIPDSVEVLTAMLWKCQSHPRLLQFGRDSQLKSMRLAEVTSGLPEIAPGQAFVRLSEGTMRRFRCSFESFSLRTGLPI